jgi:hypothetical protein
VIAPFVLDGPINSNAFETYGERILCPELPVPCKSDPGGSPVETVASLQEQRRTGLTSVSHYDAWYYKAVAVPQERCLSADGVEACTRD